MADSRNANKPDKPDKNEVWSWVVIALLFAFAWPVGLIVLLAKLSDGKPRRKRATLPQGRRKKTKAISPAARRRCPTAVRRFCASSALL